MKQRAQMGCINYFAIGLQGADVVKWLWRRRGWKCPPHGSVTEKPLKCDKGMPLLASTGVFLFLPSLFLLNKIQQSHACFDLSVLHQHVFNILNHRLSAAGITLCLCQTEQRCTQIWCIFPPVRTRNTQSNLIHAVQVVVKSCDS